MKQLTSIMVAALVAAPAFAELNSAWTRKQTEDPRVLRETLDTNFGEAETRIAAVEAKAALVVNTNTTIDATSVAPAFVGQILYGSVSNRLFVATGATTNDWKEITMTAE